MKIIKIDNLKKQKEFLERLDVSKEGIAILTPKMQKELFFISNLKTPAANILKQDSLSIGADLAVPKNTICCSSEFVDCLLIATNAQLKKLVTKIKNQPFGLKKLSSELKSFFSPKSFTTKIMGVINANDDSFFEGSRFCGKDAIVTIEHMIEDGANIIDIGGVSSRPGSFEISEDEELERVKEIIDEIYSQKLYEKIKFSLDSYQPKVIKYAFDRGFRIINDITGLQNDEVCNIARSYQAEVVIMHMQKKPINMQENPIYTNVILEIEEFFENRINKALSYDIKNIILDVGIGFGKSLNHNLELINYLSHFKKFNLELLIGASRKSMINMIVKSTPQERLGGSLAIHLKAIENGASIIRCHDVKEHFQAIKIYEALQNTTLGES